MAVSFQMEEESFCVARGLNVQDQCRPGAISGKSQPSPQLPLRHTTSFGDLGPRNYSDTSWLGPARFLLTQRRLVWMNWSINWWKRLDWRERPPRKWRI